MKFSQKEIKDFLGAWLLISLAFAVLFTGSANLSPSIFITSFIISLLTAGIGFLFHELMHKYLAQKYHLWAEFRASYPMLWLAVIFSFFGFIIAAPGGVLIQGNLTREKNGKISLAGPTTNLIIAILFLIPLLTISSEGILNLFLVYGFKINSLLALFNLIPFLPFDGYKVLAWNKTVYCTSAFFSLLLFIISFFV